MLSCLERKLSVSRQLFCSVWSNVLLLWKCHITDPDLLVSFQSYNQVFFLAVVVYCRWNSKSHTSFALSFSSTFPLSHHCTRWLLRQLIPAVLPMPLQESSVFHCVWLDIHCSSYQVLYRFRMLCAYSGTTIVCQVSRFFP